MKTAWIQGMAFVVLVSWTTRTSGGELSRPLPDQGLRSSRVAGSTDLDTYFLERFAFIFGPQDPGDWGLPDRAGPTRSATELVREFQLSRDRLRPATVAAVESMLARERAAHTYDTEHYRFSYDTEGVDAVPPDDTDGDGVPDYVENLGIYAEYAWQVEFEELGFVAPKRSPAQGHRLHVIIQQMNAYGMTICTGFCTIRIENDFRGFGSNDDPDGPVAGAAKVTIAHELKHASQWETSNMTELGWIEVDATWMEDVVYPEVNDYVQYVNSSESQVTTPSDPLDKWLYGSYPDVIWQISMSERFGTGIIVDLWAYRAHHRAEGMLTSYDAILRAYGTDLEAQFALDYMVRNYLTGARTPTVSDVPYYPDAEKFHEGPVMPLPVPARVEGELPHLAGAFFEAGPDDDSRAPTVTLEADPEAVMAVSALLWSGAGGVTVRSATMEAGVARLDLDVPWSRLDRLGLVVVNAERAAPSTAYVLTVE